MSETQTVEVSKPEEVKSGMSVSSFEGTQAPTKEAAVIPISKPAETPAPAAATTEVAITSGEDIWTKETGWKNIDEAKAAKLELEEFKKNPRADQPKYSPEEREKLFEDAYPILEQKKKLERIEKLDATKPKDAAEIIKTGLLYNNKDLTADDVDFMFSEKYDTPEKPIQGEDQEDDAYAKSVAKWERQVELINKRMAIDAKLAKPELSKLKSELVLPDISRAESQPQQQSQESLDAQKALRENFLRSVDSDFSKFDGFTTRVKDESVEFPVMFKADDKDKAEIKKLAQEMTIEDYFGKRWFDDNGNAKVEQLMSDLFLLEKTEKAFQAVANGAASERRKEIIKQNSNIKLNGVTSSQTNLQRPPEQEKKYLEEKALWG